MKSREKMMGSTRKLNKVKTKKRHLKKRNVRINMSLCSFKKSDEQKRCPSLSFDYSFIFFLTNGHQLPSPNVTIIAGNSSGRMTSP